MDELAINRADSIKQALQALTTHKLPWSLQWAQRSVLTYFSLPTKFLTGLGLVRRSERALRLEGLERNALMLMVLLKYVDLASMQVGVPKAHGGFLGLTYRFFAKQLGWRTDEDDEVDKKLIKSGKRPKERGIKRVARFFEGLRKAGYVVITQKSKMHDNGTYEGMAAIKRVSSKLFYDLGVTKKTLSKCREQAKKRLLKLKDAYKQKLIELAQTYIAPAKPALGRARGDDDLAKRKLRSSNIQRLRLMPENKDLSSSEFYLKYPSLKPDG